MVRGGVLDPEGEAGVVVDPGLDLYVGSLWDGGSALRGNGGMGRRGRE